MSAGARGKRDEDAQAGYRLLESFHDWAKLERRPGEVTDPSDAAFAHYFHGIAEARYVIRKVFRIVDEQARHHGLEPLEHQALIQIFGGSGTALRVNDIAERLDIAPAFASRLIRALEARGLATRSPSEHDRRITLVQVTPAARELLAAIDSDVHLHVQYFQRSLSDAARVTALGIFSFYLGVSPKARDLERLFGDRSVSGRR